MLRSLVAITLGISVLSVDAFKTNHDSTCSSNHLKVQTSSGVVFGAVNGVTPNVRAFLGIPYAQPPIGDLRWLPAVAVNDTNRIIDASQFGPSCPQDYALRDSYSTETPQFLVNGPMNEDCLSLSIWTPAKPKNGSLPVIIWIHGGGLNFGSASVPYQIPAKWVERSQSHIVVSLQYRLNILGFPNAAGLDYQNLGLMDQRFAVQWVQQNIAAFGGDPERMVLWGQSGGAVSADVHNFAFPNDPIVHGFIFNSGTAFLPSYSADVGQTNFTSVAKVFNCSYANDTAKTLDCMRKVEAASLAHEVKNSVNSSYSFIPVVDDVIVFSNYTARALAGNFSSLPAIMGSTMNETTSLGPFPADPLSMGLDLSVADQLKNVLFVCPESHESKAREVVSRKTYRYRYHGNFTNISPLPWLGSYHCSDLPLIFGTEGDYRGAATPLEVATSEAMQDRWVHFAEDPEHGLEGLGWQDYSSDYMEVFAADGTAVQQGSASYYDGLCPA